MALTLYMTELRILHIDIFLTTELGENQTQLTVPFLSYNQHCSTALSLELSHWCEAVPPSSTATSQTLPVTQTQNCGHLGFNKILLVHMVCVTDCSSVYALPASLEAITTAVFPSLWVDGLNNHGGLGIF